MTHERILLFGEIVYNELRMNRLGCIVQQEWGRLAQRFDYVRCDAFVVMPNHVHGILILHESPGRRGVPLHASYEENRVVGTGVDNTSPGMGGTPLPQKRADGMPNGPPPNSLGALMAQFRSRVTKRIWGIPGRERGPIWQRNYYEHIVRSELELNQIRRYIQDNPLHWREDEEYTAHAHSIHLRQW